LRLMTATHLVANQPASGQQRNFAGALSYFNNRVDSSLVGTESGNAQPSEAREPQADAADAFDPERTKLQASLILLRRPRCLSVWRASKRWTTNSPFERAAVANTEALISSTDFPSGSTLRRETVEDAINYVVNRNIHSQRSLCRLSFCGFAQGPGAADAYSLPQTCCSQRARSLDTGATEVASRAAAARSRWIFYRDNLAPSSTRFPPCSARFSHGDFIRRRKTGMPLRDYLQMMKDEGWAAFPEPPPKFWMTAYAGNSALRNCRGGWAGNYHGRHELASPNSTMRKARRRHRRLGSAILCCARFKSAPSILPHHPSSTYHLLAVFSYPPLL